MAFGGNYNPYSMQPPGAQPYSSPAMGGYRPRMLGDLSSQNDDSALQQLSLYGLLNAKSLGNQQAAPSYQKPLTDYTGYSTSSGTGTNTGGSGTASSGAPAGTQSSRAPGWNGSPDTWQARFNNPNVDPATGMPRQGVPSVDSYYGSAYDQQLQQYNSPEYAAYYNSLPPSTRAYMHAPGNAALGNYLAEQWQDNYNAFRGNPWTTPRREW